MDSRSLGRETQSGPVRCRSAKRAVPLLMIGRKTARTEVSDELKKKGVRVGKNAKNGKEKDKDKGKETDKGPAKVSTKGAKGYIYWNEPEATFHPLVKGT